MSLRSPSLYEDDAAKLRQAAVELRDDAGKLIVPLRESIVRPRE